MSTPISVFIMDVSASRQLDKQGRLDLQQHITNLNSAIGAWTNGITICKTDFRMGDELLLVAQHFVTAYVIAFYIKLHWPLQGHEPYFGITYGDTDYDLASIDDIDQWTDPLIEDARLASDFLKSIKKNRPWMSFQSERQGEHGTIAELNDWIEVHDFLIRSQTRQQRHVSALCTAFDHQNEVAELLRVKPPTISKALDRGQFALLMKTGRKIASILSQRQMGSSENTLLSSLESRLHASIRTYLRQQITQGNGGFA